MGHMKNYLMELLGEDATLADYQQYVGEYNAWLDSQPDFEITVINTIELNSTKMEEQPVAKSTEIV